MQIELSQQFLLDSQLGIISTKEETIWQNHCSASILCQAILNHHHKEVSRFARSEVGWEVALHIVLLVTTVWRIHQDDIKLIVIGIVQHILRERVAMKDLGRIDIMQQHIRDAKHIGELLLLDAIDGVGKSLTILSGVHLLIKGFEP